MQTAQCLWICLAICKRTGAIAATEARVRPPAHVGETEA